MGVVVVILGRGLLVCGPRVLVVGRARAGRPQQLQAGRASRLLDLLPVLAPVGIEIVDVELVRRRKQHLLLSRAPKACERAGAVEIRIPLLFRRRRRRRRSLVREVVGELEKVAFNSALEHLSLKQEHLDTNVQFGLVQLTFSSVKWFLVFLFGRVLQRSFLLREEQR